MSRSSSRCILVYTSLLLRFPVEVHGVLDGDGDMFPVLLRRENGPAHHINTTPIMNLEDTD